MAGVWIAAVVIDGIKANWVRKHHGNDAYDGAEVESERLFYPEILSGQSESRFSLYGRFWAIDKLAKARFIADSRSQRPV